MNWKEKSFQRSVRIFSAPLNEKNLKEMMDLLGNSTIADLIDSFYSAYNRGEMRISQRRGVINNWHPITLNLDHKSVSKVIARKIERVLPHLVCQDQSGFKREDIWAKTFDLLKIFWNKQDNRISQVSSCKQAFERKFKQDTISLFNLGSPSKAVFQLSMLRNIQCSVLNNGLSRNYFTLLRGVRQGCPLFPFLFVLKVELLVDKKRRSREQKFFKRNLKWVNLLMTPRFLTAISHNYFKTKHLESLYPEH